MSHASRTGATAWEREIAHQPETGVEATRSEREIERRPRSPRPARALGGVGDPFDAPKQET